MSWSKQGSGGKRRGYHHGNLKDALVNAALDLISERGPAGFTFADAARAAGVSAAAPYRHFRDRDELVAEVARRGFEQFADKLRRAWDSGRPDPVNAFDRVGHAYLNFARDEAAAYSAMFESGLPPSSTRELQQAADKAFEVLKQASEALCASLPADERAPPMMVALHMWAMSHGIASLFARGDSGRRKLPMQPEQLLEAGFLVYLRGIGMFGKPK